MTSIVFMAFDGTSRAVDAEPGQSVMQAAVNNRVPGIVGECGGSMACGSCHVYVDPPWLARTGGPSDLEAGMLQIGLDSRSNSRLACQIRLTEELDGLVVQTPERQGF